MTILLAVGFWLRIRNLGALGFVVDEGMQALSVQGVLKHGIPLMDSGLVLPRALSYLYIQAFFARVFELNEFWLRFPSVLFGVAVIVLAYILGKMLFGWRIGLLTAVFLTFSTWEIELSRYARFYTAFQFMFVVSSIFFYKGFMLNIKKYKLWFLLAALFAFSTHHLGQVLIVFFLIPLLSRAFTRKEKLDIGLWSIGFLSVLLLYQQLLGLFRSFGANLPYNIDTADNTAHFIFPRIKALMGILPFELPDLSLFFKITQQNPWLIAALAFLSLIVTTFLICRFFRGDPFWRTFIGLLIVWAVFFYQFLIAFILAIIYVALGDKVCNQGDSKRYARLSTLLYFICWGVYFIIDLNLNYKKLFENLFIYPPANAGFFYWFALVWPVLMIMLGYGNYILFSRSKANRDARVLAIFSIISLYLIFWSLYFQKHLDITIQQIFINLFGYPPVLASFLRWFVLGWPALTLIAGWGIYILIIRSIANKSDFAALFILGVLFISLLGASLFRRIPASRYMFHMYPIIIIIFSFTLTKMVAQLGKILAPFGKRVNDALFIFLTLVLLFACQDGNPLLAWRIGERTYQSRKDAIRNVLNWTPHAYYHQDVKNPSLFVRSRILPGEKVMIVGPTYIDNLYHYYLGKIDYSIGSKDYGRVKDGRFVNYVSGSILLTHNQEIQKTIEENKHGLWLLGDLSVLDPESIYYSTETKDYLLSLVNNPLYMGRDGVSFVVKLH